MIALGVSTIVVLVALAAALFLPLRNRTAGTDRSGHRAGLAWHHHLGCSLADTRTTSSTIFLASDLCISIKHAEGGTDTESSAVDEPTNGPTTVTQFVAAAQNSTDQPVEHGRPPSGRPRR